MKEQVRLVVSGRVQGVFFRDSARRKAKKIGLVGWVMNQEDGTVKIMAEGEKDKLEEFIQWCYNGPIMAKVDKVKEEWKTAQEKFDKFEIRH